MKLSKLNGWQRVWLAFAVMALLFALLYSFANAGKYGASTDDDVVAAYDNPTCAYLLKLPEGFVLDSAPEYGTPCYDLYTELRNSVTPPRTLEAYETQASARYRESLLNLLGATLSIWAVCIALLYGAGATVAWIRRGFRGAT